MLTQLVGGRGCLGGLRTPKHPQFPLELRKSYQYYLRCDMEVLSWSQISQWREECFQLFGDIQSLPIRSPWREIEALSRHSNRLLDIGAGVHKPVLNSLKIPKEKYYSLDIDPEGDFNYSSFDQIPEDLSFDLMIANQLLEHITIREAHSMFISAYKHLEEGGHFVATVPNAAHPVRQWTDATHITAWPIGDLYGLFRSTGYRIKSLGRYNKFPLTKNPIKRAIVHIVCETFRMDWCNSLMIVAYKESGIQSI